MGTDEAPPVIRRTTGYGCPQSGREAGCNKTRQPSISTGPPHLLAEWDWKANERQGWHPDQVTLSTAKKVHWVVQASASWGWCTDGRQHRSTGGCLNSPSHVAWLCALANLWLCMRGCAAPEAADLWDYGVNGRLDPL